MGIVTFGARCVNTNINKAGLITEVFACLRARGIKVNLLR